MARALFVRNRGPSPMTRCVTDVRPVSARRLTSLLAATAVLAPVLGLADGAQARMTILYDQPGIHDLLVQPGPNGEPGLGVADRVFQQQPTFRVLPASQQAWKVSGARGSRATPTLIGRGPRGMAKLLRDRVRRSGAKMVFLDELASRFRGGEGDDLGAAMSILEREQSPVGGPTSRRVHIYVLSPAVLMAQPQAWSGSWDALVRAGGVWLEAYHRGQPWAPEQWLAWPGAFAREFVARGGDPTRLHLLMTGDTPAQQREQWAWARTGAACPILANGPGAYRVDRAAPYFVQEFRRTFGTAPAPEDGPSALTCTPAPTLSDEETRRISVPLSTERVGYELGRGALGSPRVYAGIEQRVRVRLGRDPLGLAASLGREPRAFWGGAKARVRAEGDGWRTSAPVRADGTARITLLPRAEGPVQLRLIVPSKQIRRALGPPRDLVASLEPYAPVLGGVYRRIIRSPRSWTLNVPLGLSGRAPAEPDLYAYRAPGADEITELTAKVAGPRETRALGRASARWRLVLVQARTAEGVPVPAASLRVRRTDGTSRVVRTDVRGRARVLVPWRRGRVQADVRGVTGAPRAKVLLSGPARR